MPKQNPIRPIRASKIRDFSDRLLGARPDSIQRDGAVKGMSGSGPGIGGFGPLWRVGEVQQPVDEVVRLGFRRVGELAGESAMAMGRSGALQDDLMATWAEMPRSPGHAFYDRLQDLLSEAGFDAFVEEVCKPQLRAADGRAVAAAGAASTPTKISASRISPVVGSTMPIRLPE